VLADALRALVAGGFFVARNTRDLDVPSEGDRMWDRDKSDTDESDTGEIDKPRRPGRARWTR
jgi:hypothetical protein